MTDPMDPMDKPPVGFWANVWDGMGLGALWRWMGRKIAARGGEKTE